MPNKLVVLANAFWSDGGAHYLVGTGPQLVVRPNFAGTDVSLSMVHAGAGSAGLEWRASQKEAFAVYYGADYFGRNFFPDTTNTTNPGTIIGYGGPGSPNTNNRAIQQVTFDWLLTFWKSQRHGALQYYTQYSYLTRAPWFVAPDESQERASQHGLCRRPLRFAVNFRHPAARALPQLKICRRCDAIELRT